MPDQAASPAAHASFREQLTAAWQTIQLARGDGHWSVAEAIGAVGEVMHAGSQLCAQTVGDDAAFEQLVLDFQWLVDSFVVPMKVVPNTFLENILDKQLSASVRPTLEGVRKAIMPK